MSSGTSDLLGFAPTPGHVVVRSALKRLPGMLVVWGAIGAAVGVLTAQTPGPIGIVAGIIAGLIVITPLGALLTLIGGRARESLLGAALGVVLVPALARLVALPVTAVSLAPFGLILGALVGATAVTALYRLPLLVLSAGRGARPVESNSP
jgi:hypothetical protein